MLSSFVKRMAGGQHLRETGISTVFSVAVLQNKTNSTGTKSVQNCYHRLRVTERTSYRFHACSLMRQFNVRHQMCVH